EGGGGRRGGGGLGVCQGARKQKPEAAKEPGEA
ncbi:MAG: hypothetical protein RLZZ142_2576, partial [Verrucomicrobiota bacterium]